MVVPEEERKSILASQSDHARRSLQASCLLYLPRLDSCSLKIDHDIDFQSGKAFRVVYYGRTDQRP